MPEVLMPRLSDTMTEGVLSQWVKNEGDAVHRGDVLAEIETDKATMELEAYDDGVLTQLLVPAGETVPIGQPIAIIDGGDGGTPPPSSRTAPSTPTPAPEPAPTRAEAPPPTSTRSPAPTPSPAPAPAPAPAGTAVRTSPLARAIARDHGIDLNTVAGTGPGGRIVRADVEAAVAAHDAAPAPAPGAEPAPAPAATAPSASAPSATTPADDEEIPLTAIRRVTARRLSESATVPHFDLTTVVDVAALLAFRAEINDRLAPARISVNDLLVRACAVTLRGHPQLNSSWGGEKILRHRRIHIGVAVALDDGLIVPVLHDADRKSVGEISAEARTLAERARAGRLSPDEFTGGTFTISNLGMFGIDHFTAVINPPEAAILAVGSATPEPVVRDGAVVPGTTMRLTLSIDHRVSDGAAGAAFLRDLRRLLEEPLRIVV